MKLLIVFAIVLVATAAAAGIVQVGYLETDQPVQDMVLVGDTAYLAAYLDGLIVVDLSDPTVPVVLDVYGAGDRMLGVAVVGDLVYVAGEGMLRILDATDRTALSLVGEEQLGVANKVVVQGDHAYVACGYLGLKTVDISDPTAPFTVARFDAPQDLHSIAVAVEGEYAYVTNADLGGYPVFIIDVSDPADLWMPGWFYTVSSEATAVRDGFTYTSDGDFFITDVDDPTQPVRTATVSRLDGRGIALVGDRAYLSCYSTGLAIVDVGDPYAPRTDGGFYTGTTAWAVPADGNLVLLGNYDVDVWILVDDPATAAPAPAPASPALSARPNPFNPRTVLRLDIPRADHVRLAIHDLRGRRVRDLLDCDLAAGHHDVTWDGADASGRVLPAGIYVAVLNAGGSRVSTRLSLVK